jgi:hypothetical protein
MLDPIVGRSTHYNAGPTLPLQQGQLIHGTRQYLSRTTVLNLAGGAISSCVLASASHLTCFGIAKVLRTDSGTDDH